MVFPGVNLFPRLFIIFFPDLFYINGNLDYAGCTDEQLFISKFNLAESIDFLKTNKLW